MRNAISTLVVLLGGLFAADIQACSCVSIDTKEQLQKSAFVFVAKVTSISDSDSPHGPIKLGVFETVEALKGDPTEIPHLQSSNGMCWLPISAGQTYLIFTDLSGAVTHCSGSAWIDGDYRTVPDVVRRIRSEMDSLDATSNGV